MQVKYWKHKNVNKDGTIKNNKGAVYTEGRLFHGNGCDLPKCKCSEGLWVSIGLPRTKKGIVQGITINDLSKAEYNSLLKVLKI